MMEVDKKKKRLKTKAMVIITISVMVVVALTILSLIVVFKTRSTKEHIEQSTAQSTENENIKADLEYLRGLIDVDFMNEFYQNGYDIIDKECELVSISVYDNAYDNMQAKIDEIKVKYNDRYYTIIMDNIDWKTVDTIEQYNAKDYIEDIDGNFILKVTGSSAVIEGFTTSKKAELRNIDVEDVLLELEDLRLLDEIGNIQNEVANEIQNLTEPLNETVDLSFDSLTLLELPEEISNDLEEENIIEEDILIEEEIEIEDNLFLGEEQKIYSNIVIPDVIVGADGKEYTVIEIGDLSFSFKNIVGELVIPKNVAEIGHGAFAETQITSLRLNTNKITTIDDYAFSNCDRLTGEIIIPSSIERISVRSFESSNISKLIVCKEEGIVINSPWGANNAVIEYTP